MAVAFEGFSIREYTAKTRSVNVLKCYPFNLDDDVDEGGDDIEKKKKKEEEVEALLPPITVTKFRWWAHELHSQETFTLVNKESSEIPRNDIEFTAVRHNNQVAADDDDSDEAEKSSSETSLVCPVCKDFSAATVNAVNAHIDSCLAQTSRRMRKAKSKPPKKRSIAEIFAVAPQIQTHEDHHEDEDGDDNCKLLVESNGSVSRLKAKKVKRKKEKKRVSLLEEKKINKLNKKMMIMKTNKKKKNKKKKKHDGSIAKKENSCKLKLQNPVNFAKKLNKKFALDIWDAVTVRARTPNLKYLSAKKRKVVLTSKLIPKHPKPVFAVRSILKNHEVCGQNSTFCSIQGDDGQPNPCDDSQPIPCGIQHTKRHVQFSGKDHILGPRKNGLSSFENNNFGSLLSDTFSSSSEKDQSSDSSKEAVPMEVVRRENDASSIGTDNASIDRRDTEASSILGRKQFPVIPDHAGIPSFLRPHITYQEQVKHLPEKSIPTNKGAVQDDSLRMFEQGYPTTMHEPAYAGIPRLISALEQPCVNTQGVTVSRAFDSSGKMIDHAVRPIHGVAAMSSKENTRAFPVPSSSNFTLNENAKGPPFLSLSEKDNFSDRGLHCQSLCQPTNLLGDSYPFPECKQRAHTFRERRVDEEFIGLPLNSQGELIQPRKLNTVPGSSSSIPVQNFPHLTNMSSLPAHNFTQFTSMGDLNAYSKHLRERELPNDHLSLFPMQNYMKGNPSAHLPDRIGATYSESTQSEDIQQFNFENRSSHCFRPLGSEPNLMNFSVSGHRLFDQVQNQNIGGLIPKEISGNMSLNMNQPTMRLMGKDVAIGKSSREIQGFEDGKVWTDKEIIAEHCPSGTASHSSSLKRNFQQNWFPHTAGKLKQTVAESLEINSEQAPQDNFLLKAPGYMFPHPYHNWQSNSVFQNGSFTANRSPGSNLIHFAHVPTSPAMFSGAPNFQESFISGAESLESLHFGSQRPILSAPQNTCGHGVLRPAELNYKQNPPHFTKSAFCFPFLNPECGENVQSSWFHSSSKGLPPWLLHATLQGKPQHTSSETFPNVGSNHHQQIMPRNNNFDAGPMHHSSEISYPCTTMTSHSQVKSSPSPATTVLPPFVPVNQGVRSKPTSVINMGYRNRLKSKASSIKDSYPYKKPKKLAAKVVDSTKPPPNMFNLEMQEKLSAVAGPSRGNFFSDMQSNLRAIDLDSGRKKASDLESSLNETIEIQEDGFGTFGVLESSKVDDIVRSGPIKLCAGAKHILKPTQNVDEDNSRPIHSTIAFAAVTNGSREPETQKKSTKVYRF